MFCLWTQWQLLEVINEQTQSFIPLYWKAEGGLENIGEKSLTFTPLELSHESDDGIRR